MELTPDQVADIEAALERLTSIDPTLLPEPAAELAELLGRILDDLEES